RIRKDVIDEAEPRIHVAERRLQSRSLANIEGALPLFEEEPRLPGPIGDPTNATTLARVEERRCGVLLVIIVTVGEEVCELLAVEASTGFQIDESLEANDVNPIVDNEVFEGRLGNW